VICPRCGRRAWIEIDHYGDDVTCIVGHRTALYPVAPVAPQWERSARRVRAEGVTGRPSKYE